MTTIAWDGVFLAGDTQTLIGELRDSMESKVWKLKDGSLFGCSGSVFPCLRVKDWIESGSHEATRPKLVDENEVNFIYVNNQGEAFRGEGTYMRPIVGRYHAIGNGYQIAATALHLGKTATEAVTLAALLSPYTGGLITSVSQK